MKYRVLNNSQKNIVKIFNTTPKLGGKPEIKMLVRVKTKMHEVSIKTTGTWVHNYLVKEVANNKDPSIK